MKLFVLVFRMIYYGGVNVAPKSNTFAGHVKNDEANVEKIPTTAAMKRSAAKLRKVRWDIYQKIKSNTRNVSRSLGFYMFLIKKFLQRFSAKLKQKENLIWKEKLTRTSTDVKKFLTKAEVHHHGKNKNVLAEKEVKKMVSCGKCCMVNHVISLDTVFVIVFTLLNLFNTDQGNKKVLAEVSRAHNKKREEISEEFEERL